MDLKIIENELEKLQSDKQNIDIRINQLTEELKNLEKNSLIMSGAIQTCMYFLKTDENDAPEDDEDDTE